MKIMNFKFAKLTLRLKPWWLCSLLATVHFSWAAALCKLPLSPGTNIVWLKNISQQAYWIDHPTHRPVSAGWSSWLEPGHYSILILQGRQPASIFALSTQNLACPKVLHTWVLSPPPWIHQISGEGWASENQGFLASLITLTLGISQP